MMKRVAKYFLMALVFTVGMLVTTGCGADGHSAGTVEYFIVSDEVQAVAASLFTAEELDGLTIGLGEVHAPEGVQGLCEYGPRRISIDAKAWAGMSKIQREIIVAHEVGHCGFNREHDTRTDKYAPKACPNSIMFPSQILQTCWYLYSADYLKDLRNH
jgi:hypothetical protein